MEITSILEKHKLNILEIQENILDNEEIIITSRGLRIIRHKNDYTEMITYPKFDIETQNYMEQVE